MITPAEDDRYVVTDVVANELVRYCEPIAFDAEFYPGLLAGGHVVLKSDEVRHVPILVVQRSDRIPAAISSPTSLSTASIDSRYSPPRSP